MIDTEQLITAVFNELDEEHTRYIDISEYYAGLCQFVPEASFDAAKALFKISDIQKNNRIDLKQFTELVHFYVKNQDDEDEYSILFKKCSSNGFVQIEQVHQMFIAINNKLTKERIDEVCKECHKEQEDKLNYQEYMSCASKVRYETHMEEYEE
ncbi:EF hand calcium-binding domain containing protein [Entamoeba histolytica KU27]|uniref:EF hand calcium-binding domain containing protein n=1 Tax=Entamoeba histolytica KU27 TaxID=885311 RepID=M2SCF2_ENTHI|nr:EF hand calcium-binding domain containing protein [Entamoeba histolytica KU27]